jgi:hypothetical protein
LQARSLQNNEGNALQTSELGPSIARVPMSEQCPKLQNMLQQAVATRAAHLFLVSVLPVSEPCTVLVISPAVGASDPFAVCSVLLLLSLHCSTVSTPACREGTLQSVLSAGTHRTHFPTRTHPGAVLPQPTAPRAARPAATSSQPARRIVRASPPWRPPRHRVCRPLPNRSRSIQRPRASCSHPPLRLQSHRHPSHPRGSVSLDAPQHAGFFGMHLCSVKCDTHNYLSENRVSLCVFSGALRTPWTTCTRGKRCVCRNNRGQ